jgi:hypothetical protein
MRRPRLGRGTPHWRLQAVHRLVGTVSRRIALAALAVATMVPMGTASAAGADGSTQLVRQQVVGMTFLNPCTAEYITITGGTLQFLIRMSQDAAGGRHAVIHGSAQGVVATGEITGDTYRLAGDFWIEENASGGGFPLVVQMVEVHDVLSEGSADNLIIRLVSHLTVNADGTVTALVDSVRTECRG